MSIAEARKKLAESTKSLEIVKSIRSGALNSAEINRRLPKARSEYETLNSRGNAGIGILAVTSILGLVFVIGFDLFAIGFSLQACGGIVFYFLSGRLGKDGKKEELEIKIKVLEMELAGKKRRKSEKIQSLDRASTLLQKGGLANLQEVLKIYSRYGKNVKGLKKEIAQEKEKLLDYAGAIEGFKELGLHKDAKRVRRKMLDEKKVDQTVVQGDYVDDRDTIVKDSIINRSNIGGNSKAEGLREAKSLFEEGLIDESEYKQMKKEILGK